MTQGIGIQTEIYNVAGMLKVILCFCNGDILVSCLCCIYSSASWMSMMVIQVLICRENVLDKVPEQDFHEASRMGIPRVPTFSSQFVVAVYGFFHCQFFTHVCSALISWS